MDTTRTEFTPPCSCDACLIPLQPNIALQYPRRDEAGELSELETTDHDRQALVDTAERLTPSNPSVLSNADTTTLTWLPPAQGSWTNQLARNGPTASNKRRRTDSASHPHKVPTLTTSQLRQPDVRMLHQSIDHFNNIMLEIIGKANQKALNSEKRSEALQEQLRATEKDKCQASTHVIAAEQRLAILEARTKTLEEQLKATELEQKRADGIANASEQRAEALEEQIGALKLEKETAAQQQVTLESDIRSEERVRTLEIIAHAIKNAEAAKEEAKLALKRADDTNLKLTAAEQRHQEEMQRAAGKEQDLSSQLVSMKEIVQNMTQEIATLNVRSSQIAADEERTIIAVLPQDDNDTPPEKIRPPQTSSQGSNGQNMAPSTIAKRVEEVTREVTLFFEKWPLWNDGETLRFVQFAFSNTPTTITCVVCQDTDLPPYTIRCARDGDSAVVSASEISRIFHWIIPRESREGYREAIKIALSEHSRRTIKKREFKQLFNVTAKASEIQLISVEKLPLVLTDVKRSSMDTQK